MIMSGAKGRQIATQAPATTGATQAPATTGATQAPATTGATQAPATTGATQAPATTEATQAPATTGATQAPATTEATQAPATTGVELDASTPPIPWDARIHTSTQKKTQAGIWKRKPRVDDAYFESVVAELSSGKLNHPQLLNRMFAAVASSEISIFKVDDVLRAIGLKTLNEASGKPDVIEHLAKELGLLDE